MAAESLDRRSQVRKSQIIDFPNAAAGHDGVKSTKAGDVVLKPCKNAEVAFYQTTHKTDPGIADFAYYMPKFFGTLDLREGTAAPPLLSQHPPGSGYTTSPNQLMPEFHPGTPTSTGSGRGAHGRSPSRTSMISHLPVDESLAPTKPPKAWEPSNGAKIQADTYVVMENVAAGLAKPNILDVKLGSRLWADDAPSAKRQKLEKDSIETTSGSLGFRIAGMKLWAGHGAYEQTNRDAMDRAGGLGESSQFTETPSTSSQGAAAAIELDAHGLPKPSIREDDYASYEREYGRALTAENIKRGLEEYFYRPSATGIRKTHALEIVSRFVEDLKGLQTVMEGMESRMYSASLLFVYEGDGEALRGDLRREDQMLREARLAREEMGLQGGAEHIAVPGKPSEESITLDSDELAGLIADGTLRPFKGDLQATLQAAQPEASPTIPSASTAMAEPALSPSVQAATTSTAASDILGPIAPSLPMINVGGSSLDIPAQLIITDDQLAADSDQGDHGDGDDSGSDDSITLPKIQAVKVIDFAHAELTPGKGPDENFLQGVRNLIRIMEEMLQEGGGN